MSYHVLSRFVTVDMKKIVNAVHIVPTFIVFYGRELNDHHPRPPL
jgi:hypothetical protein